jgi:hypothetical protein
MIPAPSRLSPTDLPDSVAELRATEVYVQMLSTRLTLTAGENRNPELGAQLLVVHRACLETQNAVRLLLLRLDPEIARTADDAADLARQCNEAMAPS